MMIAELKGMDEYLQCEEIWSYSTSKNYFKSKTEYLTCMIQMANVGLYWCLYRNKDLNMSTMSKNSIHFHRQLIQ